MAAVAREAGVGKGTLSHRFPSRQDLVAAVFADRMDAYADAAPAAKSKRRTAIRSGPSAAARQSVDCGTLFHSSHAS
ncbi:helix-turn-helix domain-containing protein [Lentzea fradiae]|uniref:helix-turn-helix domain-containing protein n=1 Tax=Lentzea fradiae TaxID=200378 RepID=UPI000B7FC856|nr:helix-turn-helix domain-containing protein [Lentzea fradiae]